MMIVTGIIYLGGYIRDTGTQAYWLREKFWYWVGRISTMAGVVCRHQQADYAGLQKSLQQEWYFVQRSTQCLGDDFWVVYKALQEEFLPLLIQGSENTMPGWVIMVLTVKRSVI